MHVVADENIPQVEAALKGFADVTLKAGRSLTRDDLAKADALLVRSVTKVNHALLENTPVKFVGSATIGMDHINTQKLDALGIAYTNAAGCNANSVVEYILSAMMEMAVKHSLTLAGMTLGIAGKGNIGKPLSKKAQLLGLKVICHDPPLEEKGEEGDWVDFETLLRQSDFLTFHVPITRDGKHPTFHMINAESLKNIKNTAILMNASRGEVFDNKALFNAVQQNRMRDAILDVWENEPSIDRKLMESVAIASPHIAGYSQEGKLNGTTMITQKLLKHFGRDTNWQPNFTPPKNSIITSKNKSFATLEEEFQSILRKSYNLFNDDESMRDGDHLSEEEWRGYFDSLRKNYPLRREFAAYTLYPAGFRTEVVGTCQKLGFQIGAPE